MNIDGEHIEANASAQRIGGPYWTASLTKTSRTPMAKTVRQKGVQNFPQAKAEACSKHCSALLKLAVILRIAFFRMVIKTGTYAGS